MNVCCATEYKNTSHMMCVFYYFMIFSSFMHLQRHKKLWPRRLGAPECRWGHCALQNLHNLLLCHWFL